MKQFYCIHLNVVFFGKWEFVIRFDKEVARDQKSREIDKTKNHLVNLNFLAPLPQMVFRSISVEFHCILSNNTQPFFKYLFSTKLFFLFTTMLDQISIHHSKKYK